MARFALLAFALSSLTSCGLLDLSPYEDITGTYTSLSGNYTLTVDHQSDGTFSGTMTASGRLERGSVVYLFHTEAVEGTIAEGDLPTVSVGVRYQRCGDITQFKGTFYPKERGQQLVLRASGGALFFWGDRSAREHCEPMQVRVRGEIVLSQGFPPKEPRWAASRMRVKASRTTVAVGDRFRVTADSLPRLVECHPDCNRFEEQGWVLLTDDMARLMREDGGDASQLWAERMHDSALIHGGNGIYEATECGETWAGARIFERSAHWFDRPKYRSYYYPFHPAFGDTVKITVAGPEC